MNFGSLLNGGTKFPFLIGNWKMHGDTGQIQNFIYNINNSYDNVVPILCFPFPYLALARSILPQNYKVGAQDCSQLSNGAFTGQVSAAMLKDVGCEYVIIGHPERSSFETAYDVQEKILQAVEANLVPILCGNSAESIRAKIPSSLSEKIIIAYEPAVGADRPPSDLLGPMKELRSLSSAPLLYGGGINKDTIPPLLGLFDGFLVGRASLNAEQWNAIVSIISVSAEIND